LIEFSVQSTDFTWLKWN